MDSYIRKLVTIFSFVLAINPYANVFSQTAIPSDTLTLLQVSDIHRIFDPEDYDSAWVSRRLDIFGRDHDRFIQFLKSVPRQTNADAVMMTGDLIDFYEARRADQPEQMKASQIGEFAAILNSVDLSMPVYPILGNHDIASRPKGEGHQQHAALARADWMKELRQFRNGTYYSRLYQVGGTTYRLLFLDNSTLSPDRVKPGHIQFEIDSVQMDWLARELRQSDQDVEILVMHIPLRNTLTDDQNRTSETLAAYSDRTHSGPFLNLLAEPGSNVKLIIAGHRHKDNISAFSFGSELDFVQAVVPAFGHKTNHWRLFKLTPDAIVICNTGLQSVQEVIPVHRP